MKPCSAIRAWCRCLGLECCRSVARIEDTRAIDSDRGLGTGFFLRGDYLCEALTGKCLVLTNAHVVSDTEGSAALRPNRARISFKALVDSQAVNMQAKQLIWSSPPKELDATLLEIWMTTGGFFHAAFFLRIGADRCRLASAAR
jgi:hypothetical protein